MPTSRENDHQFDPMVGNATSCVARLKDGSTCSFDAGHPFHAAFAPIDARQKAGARARSIFTKGRCPECRSSKGEQHKPPCWGSDFVGGTSDRQALALASRSRSTTL